MREDAAALAPPQEKPGRDEAESRTEGELQRRAPTRRGHGIGFDPFHGTTSRLARLSFPAGAQRRGIKESRGRLRTVRIPYPLRRLRRLRPGMTRGSPLVAYR